MKIGIQTLLLHTNFGGILQAYALQTVLQHMGHEVYVISKDRKHVLHPVKAPLIWAKRFVNRYILGDKNSVIFLEQKNEREYPIVSQYTQLFIDTYINKLPCSGYSSLPKNCLDAIVVGSDQVWRPRYFGRTIIGDAYLAFARDWDIKRIAYAASFGTDEWEYSNTQTAECKELLSIFDAVSVREDSAVELCKKHYGVDALHVLDPTMLLDKEDYIKLVKRTKTPQSPGNLLVYLLEETPDKQAVVDAVAKRLGLIFFKVNSKIGNMTAPVEECIQLPVEQWLRGFIDADFVIADSFHACVFAIIFNKPFIAYNNKTRGAARFHSLLKMFGLENQLISSADELDIEKCNAIDWEMVNNRYNDLKNYSFKIIRNYLQ